MKKVLIGLFVVVLVFIFHIKDSDAYSITWGDWVHHAGIDVDNETGYGTPYGVYGASVDLDLWEGIGFSGYAYAEAWTSVDDVLGLNQIGSLSEASSEYEGELGDAKSFGALYNTFTLSDSGGGDIPYWLDLSLQGYLDAYLGGSSNRLGVFAGIWIEESSSWLTIDDFGDIEALINGDVGSPDPAWSFGSNYENYDDWESVGQEDSILMYATEGQEYELLALLSTYASSAGDADAYSSFGEDTLEFSLEPGEEGDIPPIPEPASMLLFGAGILGFGFTKKKRRSIKK